MLQDNKAFIQRALAAGGLLVVAAACGLIYLNTNTYPQNISRVGSTKPVLANPEVLQNWLPMSSYSYTVNHLDAYLSANSLFVTSMNAQDEVNKGAGSYDFNITLIPQDQVLQISVIISRLGSLLSTAITINGVLQTDTISSTVQSTPSSGGAITTTFTGIDALVTDGVTSSQIGVLQQAFQKFYPAASGVTIDTTHISTSLDSNSGTMTYGFPVSIDGTNYTATLNCTGATQAQLLLADPKTNHTVFNSGEVTGAS